MQIRQDFTKAMINTLQTGADNLTLADTNEEGANLLALQTRQQLSTTALSLAAQADQACCGCSAKLAQHQPSEAAGSPPFPLNQVVIRRANIARHRSQPWRSRSN